MSRRHLAIAMISTALVVGAIGAMRAGRRVVTTVDAGGLPVAVGTVPGRANEAGVPDVEGRITWVPYDDAFALAARTHRPVVLVFTATWCPQCQAYGQNVLTDARVVASSRRFVMVRVDIDERRDLNQRYGSDGAYVPRTMFFRPDGSALPELRSASRSEFVYFLEPSGPGELLGLMDRASRG